MPVDITVPQLGESVADATVASWLRQKGDTVSKDEPLLELETDKATMEVYAPVSGVITDVLHEEGSDVEVGTILCRIEEGTARPAEAVVDTASKPSPAVRRMLEEHGLDAGDIEGTGKDGRLTKADVQTHLERSARPAPLPPPPAPEAVKPVARPRTAISPSPPDPEGREERVRMNRVRKRIAERLKAAQDTAAVLTTFNEADISAVIEARAKYRDLFERKHGVRLGFMSFFVYAAVQALKDIPAVNAEIAGDEIVYKHYYHIGVAVSSRQGLVVPVLRDADRMSFAEVEKAIGEFGTRARDGSLAPDDLAGGTFTISNGGIFGSLMSTPILNPPQSAILGMHKIQARPVVVDGEIVARPMMYLALSYDHRIIDGREAVSFLVRVKDGIEDPQRILLDL